MNMSEVYEKIHKITLIYMKLYGNEYTYVNRIEIAKDRFYFNINTSLGGISLFIPSHYLLYEVFDVPESELYEYISKYVNMHKEKVKKMQDENTCKFCGSWKSLI